MSVRVILQSRMSSSRLPGKAMLNLAGRPVVVLAAQRAASTGLDVMVATSDQPEDDPIADAVDAAGVRLFRGSLDDPLRRFAGATEDLGDDDLVVRLTADNIVPDGLFVEDLVRTMRASGEAYIRVAVETIYGVGAEVFTVGLLRAADAEATEDYDREHVTPWIRRRTNDMTHPLTSERRIRCTIDTLTDYTVACTVVRDLEDPTTVPWDQMLAAFGDAGGALPDRVRVTAENAIGQGPWLLGAVQLGVSYGAANTTGRPVGSQASRMLQLAAAGGVTHVDTARAYGDSEARIGQSLAHGLSERIGVVTKIRPLDDVPDDAPAAWASAAVESSVAESLRQLRSSRVSALLLHRWADWKRGGGAVADRLARLRDERITTAIGASLSTPDELLEALADDRVGYVQLPFNALDRRWLAPQVQDALAARPDVIVTVRSVFLQGLLVGGDSVPWPANAGLDASEVRAGIARLVDELGRQGPVDLCVAYARGHAFVTSVVLGAETVEQVRGQAELMSRPPLTADEIARVHEVLPAGPETLVDPSRWTMAS
ncbi:aldo/keto reductase [Luteipulveratus halotolerans]|uniref:aldo/keto reductase n=1 Tax=Luteipulveratus halotolerans TaxID=1631356 RepID=UPI0009E2D23B|nr:aldo/keto reductase [Luteipulveratus halotolerans]